MGRLYYDRQKDFDWPPSASAAFSFHKVSTDRNDDARLPIGMEYCSTLGSQLLCREQSW